jgi:hypothetical protein
MFIVLLDEPTLFVYESPDAAVRDIEPPDARESLRAAFDDGAVPYLFESLPQESGWLGRLDRLLGEETGYRFRSAGPPDPVALIALLEEYPDYANPPEAKIELQSLLRRLQGAQAGLKPEA